jgi:predicted phage terminase large subunit-like protein
MAQDHFAQILKNPSRARCELSLYEFVKQAWHVLHPTTPMTEGWCLKTMCEHLQAVTEGHITRLLINVPPGTAKSMLTSVFWPAWEWGPRGKPGMQYIGSSYDKRLSTRDMLHMRDLVSSPWFQDRWPIKWKDDDRGKEKYSNTERGFRYAGSTGGALTGWRGQRIIVDDPHSVALAESDAERSTARFWFTETTPTRFTDPQHPVYVIIMQRLHSADISGLIIDGLMEEQDWTVLILPMEFEPKYKSWTSVPSTHGAPKWMKRHKDEGDPCPYFSESTQDDPDARLLYPQDPRTEQDELLFPERYPQDAVDQLKVQLMLDGGEYAVACQLQQRPVPREGGMFRIEQITMVDSPLEGQTVRGWDLAASKDKSSPWTVGARLTLCHDGRLCIDHVTRLRGDPHQVRSAVLTTAQLDGTEVPQDIPQDPGQAGKAQVTQFAKDLHGFECRFSPETGDKEQRAEPFAAQVNAGNVVMAKGTWNAMVLAELGLFPGSTFKDITDALSRAYHSILKDLTDPVSLFGPRLLMPEMDN